MKFNGNKSKLIHCDVCGKEIARTAKLCPYCGAKNKQRPLYKRPLLVIVGVIIVLWIVRLLVSGIGSIVSQIPSPNKTDISVQGAFAYSPTSSSSEHDSSQKYLLVVYDIANSGDANEGISVYNDAVSITINEDKYIQITASSSSEEINAFLNNCGYATSMEYGQLWNNNIPVRMIAAFVVDESALTGVDDVTLNFNLSENLTDEEHISVTDIQQISVPDGIFAVEDDPEAYQLMRSVYVLATFTKYSLDNLRQYSSSAPTDLILVILSYVYEAWHNTESGITCSSVQSEPPVSSDNTPIFDIDIIREAYPNLADSVEELINAIGILYVQSGVDVAYNQSGDSFCRALDTAIDRVNEVLEFYE